MDTVFIFAKGFSKEEIKQIVSQSESSLEEMKLEAILITDQILDKKVKDILKNITESEYPSGNAVCDGQKIIIMVLQDQKKAVNFMRKVKSIDPAFGDTAFAMLTSTALEWTFSHYLEHLTEEHDEMKAYKMKKASES